MRKHSPSSATAQSAIPDLTLMDTCDQCGAAACVRVAVTDAQCLDFCGHHYAEHAMTLLAAGYRVLDRRGRPRLNAKARNANHLRGYLITVRRQRLRRGTQ
jgi:hypothetical protein